MKRYLITGDSLSYNRYDYDDEARTNAWDCHIGMQSWSFRLRNYFITSALGFCYGDEIEFQTKVEKGVGEGRNINDAIFGERVVSVSPENGIIRFFVKSDNGIIVLYLQKRPDEYCKFSVSVDGKIAVKTVDNYGGTYDFQGYGLLTLELECDRDRNVHEIIFTDFEKCEKTPKITIAGASNEAAYSYVSGQGSRTSNFFIYHFEERIKRYAPDVMIFILGGNDFQHFNREEYEENLDKLFGVLKTEFPLCKLITITVPQGKNLGLFEGCKTDYEFNLKYTDDYNSVMKKMTEKYNGICVDTKELFKDIPALKWRFDNIHMTRYGNDVLYGEMLKIFK